MLREKKKLSWQLCKITDKLINFIGSTFHCDDVFCALLPQVNAHIPITETIVNRGDWL